MDGLERALDGADSSVLAATAVELCLTIVLIGNKG